MPPLLLLAAVGAGAYFGMKLVNRGKEILREQARHNAQSHSSTSRMKNNAENLKKDPVTGVYRVDE